MKGGKTLGESVAPQVLNFLSLAVPSGPGPRQCPAIGLGTHWETWVGCPGDVSLTAAGLSAGVPPDKRAVGHWGHRRAGIPSLRGWWFSTFDIIFNVGQGQSNG